MSSLAEFLKGTVEDSLKKLLQPAGVLPAGLFVLLNLAFVYPAAKREGVPIAESYASLDKGWQSVVIGTLTIGLGVLLLSSGNFALDTLAGRTWRDAIGAELWSKLRDWRRTRLTRKIALIASDASRREQRETELDAEQASLLEAGGRGLELLRWRLRSRFAPEGYPPDDPLASSPTSLGDALRAAGWMTAERYGMDMTVLWPPLRASIASADGKGSQDSAIEQADEEKAVLNLIGTLSFVLWAFVVEAVVVLSLLGHWSGVLTALLAVPLAFAAYLFTITKAISWTDAVDTVAALHRDKLREACHLDKPATPAEARKQFRELSYFLHWGDDDHTVTPPPQKASAKVLSNNAVAQLGRTRRDQPADVEHPQEAESSVEYMLLVTRTSVADGSQLASVLVSDPDLPHVLDPPGATVVLPGADGKPDTLVWRLLLARMGQTVTRTYTLRRWRIALSGTGRITVLETQAGSLHVSVHGPVEEGALLSLWHMRRGRAKPILTAPTDNTPTPASPPDAASDPPLATWSLPSVEKRRKLALAIRFDSRDDA